MKYFSSSLVVGLRRYTVRHETYQIYLAIKSDNIPADQTQSETCEEIEECSAKARIVFFLAKFAKNITE